MSARRFAGSALALFLALGAVGAWYLSLDPSPPAAEAPEVIFAFEKEQLVALSVERPDGTLAFERDGERWTTVGERWRPSASMMRRVAHQLHDLTARARVVDAPEDPARYGLGPDAIRVALTLDDGRKLALAVGDPNPSSVSWYMRPLPDGSVYVVKKAAVDYFRLDVESFREDRVARFDAKDCTEIEAEIGDRKLRFRRTGETAWEMLEPESWSADRDRVRRVLGAVATTRAFEFVADQPQDLEPWGLGDDADWIAVHIDAGETIRLRLGDPVPETDPPQRYAWLEGDDAVYAIRAAVAEPLEVPVGDWRNTRIVGHHPHEVRSYRVERSGEVVEATRSADEWRWDQGAAIPGATPRRVGDAAADLRAVAFHDTPPAGAFAPSWGAIEVAFDDDSTVQIELGTVFEEATGERPRTLQYARLDGSDEVYTVAGDLGQRIEDLLREHGRKAEKDAERHR